MVDENKDVNEYPVAEKQAMGAQGVPFRILRDEPRSVWHSNYAYYLKQKREGGSLKPLIGRMTDDDQFQVYIDGEWEDKDLWNDYSEPVVDDDGEPVLNEKGNQRKRKLFDNRFEYLLEFEEPITIEYWDKEERQRVTAEHQVIWLRVSKNTKNKIEQQRNTIKKIKGTEKGAYFELNYDPNKSPAEQYSVEFVHGSDE